MGIGPRNGIPRLRQTMRLIGANKPPASVDLLATLFDDVTIDTPTKVRIVVGGLTT